MRNLVIDIGNSRIKSALFDRELLVAEQVFQALDEAVDFWKTTRFASCLVSSVRFTEDELKTKLPFDFRLLTQKTPIPIKNGYSTPETLGLDRIAAAVGGWQLCGRKSVLVIDLGTCITYELVDERSTYLGGVISPGVNMRARAMTHFTAKLPEIQLSSFPQTSWGDSTSSCMEVGVWLGVRFEIDGFISTYRQKFPKISIYICGGDSQSFESLVKDHIFVVPNLVLHGLNCILNHNVE